MKNVLKLETLGLNGDCLSLSCFINHNVYTSQFIHELDSVSYISDLFSADTEQACVLHAVQAARKYLAENKNATKFLADNLADKYMELHQSKFDFGKEHVNEKCS